jgi:hypothetical protein
MERKTRKSSRSKGEEKDRFYSRNMQQKIHAKQELTAAAPLPRNGTHCHKQNKWMVSLNPHSKAYNRIWEDQRSPIVPYNMKHRVSIGSSGLEVEEGCK